MTEHALLQTLLKKIAIPKQDLTLLSFCNGNKVPQVRNWLQTLPLTQTHYVSGLFYRALPELGRLKTSVDQRIAILELVREPINNCLQGLTHRYLNQPLILPEAALKTATVAQAIQKHLLNAYLVAVHELCATPKAEETELQALAIHRALSALGQLLLRSFQLYIPVSGQVWLELHTLYQLAQVLQLTHHPVSEPLSQEPDNPSSIHLAYLRIVLLASARPNQLRQDEAATTYQALEHLSQFAELDTYTSTGQDNLFVIAINSSHPPIYKSHVGSLNTTSASELLELHTNRLVNHIKEYQALGSTDGPKGGAKDSAKDSPAPPGLKLSNALAQHLIQSWSHLAMRNFDRQDVNNVDIEITIGLTNIHFHLTNSQPFNVFLNQQSSNAVAEKESIFQKHDVQLKSTAPSKTDDPWDSAFDIKGTVFDGAAKSTANIEKDLRAHETQNYHLQHPIYSVPMIDRSPGGYGLEWRDDIPAQMKAGELIGLREYGSPRWSIGVVRWVHQLKGATQLGIQILAPQAQPIALAAIQKTGGFAEYLRALYIPALRGINQPPSVITNAISFHEYNKARLYSQAADGEAAVGDQMIQLTRRLFATGAFSQFSFRDLATTKLSGTGTKDDFDSVWKQ